MKILAKYEMVFTIPDAEWKIQTDHGLERYTDAIDEAIDTLGADTRLELLLKDILNNPAQPIKVKVTS